MCACVVSPAAAAAAAATAAGGAGQGVLSVRKDVVFNSEVFHPVLSTSSFLTHHHNESCVAMDSVEAILNYSASVLKGMYYLFRSHNAA